MSYSNQFAKGLVAHLILVGVTTGLFACADPEAISQPTPAVSAPVIPANTSPDANCDDPQTQLAMNLCSGQDAQAAATELNQAYRALMSQQSETGKAALEAAEVAWMSFRDRDCTFSKSFYEGGSIAPLIYNSCLEDQTLSRTAELRQPQPGTQAGTLDYAAADADLNQTYQLLMDATRAARQDGLVDAQLAWIDYRDRQCAFETRYQPEVTTEDQCLARITETRLQQLKDAIEQASL